MMEKGVGAENKGKTLNEIDLELEVWNNEHNGEKEHIFETNENMEKKRNNEDQFKDEKFAVSDLASSQKSNTLFLI